MPVLYCEILWFSYSPKVVAVLTRGFFWCDAWMRQPPAWESSPPFSPFLGNPRCKLCCSVVLTLWLCCFTASAAWRGVLFPFFGSSSYKSSMDKKKMLQPKLQRHIEQACHHIYSGTSLNSLPTITRYCNYHVDNRNNREWSGQDDVLCSPFYISSCKPATDFW